MLSLSQLVRRKPADLDKEFSKIVLFGGTGGKDQNSFIEQQLTRHTVATQRESTAVVTLMDGPQQFRWEDFREIPIHQSAGYSDVRPFPSSHTSYRHLKDNLASYYHNEYSPPPADCDLKCRFFVLILWGFATRKGLNYWGQQEIMPTYLVTGGAGFIGSNLVEQLLIEGADVRVIDNFSTGKRENLETFKKQIDFREVDICDLPELLKAVKGCDFIFHQAAIPSVPKSVLDPISSHNANVTGTLHVLWAAKAAGVKRVVYAASSSAYGDSQELPKGEDMPPRPISPYGLMKYIGEEYCRLFTLLYGVETVSLRYFNVFGPRQDPTSQYSGVLSRFITAMLRGDQPIIFGDGEQSRDFTYVSNVVTANLLACRCPKASGKVYNIACGTRINLKQVIEVLNRILGTILDPVFQPPRPGDIKHSMANIRRAAHEIGYSPQTSFEEGLVKTVEWYRSAS